MVQKLLIALLVCLLAAGACLAQTPATAWGFGGGTYDVKDGTVKIHGGYAAPLGKGFYIIPNGTISQFQDSLSKAGSGAVDFSKSILSSSLGSLHVLLSGGVDYVNTEPGSIAYGTLATGGFAFVNLSAFIPARGPILTFLNQNGALYFAYKFRYASGSDYRSGNSFYLGAAFKKQNK